MGNLLPTSRAGKLSVALHIFFIALIVASIILVNVLGILNYDDKWWDLTVIIAFPTSIAAFISGIRALRKYKDKSVLVIISVMLGACVISFLLLHSMFISD